MERINPMGERPAAHAFLEVQVSGSQTWYGIADEYGSVAVIFPYPTFTAPVGGGSPLSSPVTPGQQHWEVSIRVHYQPAALITPEGSRLPSLSSILNQPPGTIWTTLTTPTMPPVSQVTTELSFGQELVMRTAHRSGLLISPAGSPL